MDQFTNRVVLDEVASNEPPHLDLHCLPSSLFEFSILYSLDLSVSENLQTTIMSFVFRKLKS